MLHYIRKKLSPSIEIIDQSNHTFIQKVWILLYKINIKLLRNLYKAYSVSDTIELDDVKITHEYRDFGFEKEMSLIGIDISPKTESCGVSFSMKNRGLHWGRAFFDMCDSLTLYKGNKEFRINHSKKIETFSSFLGNAKFSNKSDIISRFSFSIIADENKPLISKSDSSKKNNNASKSDSSQTYTRRNRAMEIDDSF